MEPTIENGKQLALSANLAGSQFRDVNLEGAVFDDVNLKHSTFNNINLSGTTLTDVNLNRLAIRGCQFQGMTIDRVNVAETIRCYQTKA
jgi:uncharacterized protein YjbI with pentapeptide repeats